MLLAALLFAGLGGPDDVIRAAMTAAKTTTSAKIIRPYVLKESIYVETPFLRVALQARDAIDRYLPFSATDVDRAALQPVMTIKAYDEKRSFKHLVIAMPPPGLRPTPPPEPPPLPPLTHEEAARREKERRRKGYVLPNPAEMAAKSARSTWRVEMARFEREERAAMTIIQPTTIEATEHVWQNAFSATFKTVGVKATFPLDALAAGGQIRAIETNGSELTVDLTPEVLAGLR
jgi:hypothetical protein